MEFEVISKMIAERFSIDESKITMETNFADDLGADSLDLFEIVMELEERFNVQVPEEELENIKTVAQAVELIKSSKA